MRVVYPPRHGRVARLPDYDRAIDQFTIQDVRGGVLMYVASSFDVVDAPVYDDSVTIQISDGYHVINHVIRVTVVSKKNPSPILVTNTGIRVPSGGMTRVGNNQLQTVAAAIKDKSKIVYVIEPSSNTSTSGVDVVLMVPTLSDAPRRYTPYRAEWFPTPQGLYQSRPLTRITQRELDSGRVWFRHRGAVEDDDRIEPLQLSVYDESANPPVRVARSKLRVTVASDNAEAPRQAVRGAGTSPRVSGEGGGRMTVLHSGYLQYVDPDTGDRDIVYNITRPLPPGFGAIEHADHAFVPITVFTQADVNANKILYRPPMDGLPPRSTYLATVRPPSYFPGNRQPGSSYKYGRRQALQSAPAVVGQQRQVETSREGFGFTFTVTDGRHTLAPVNFTFQVESDGVDDSQAPEFINQYPVLEISRDGTASIGSRQLAVRDRDSSPSELVFTLLKAPRHGAIMRRGVPLRERDDFTYEDVREHLLRYIYRGGTDARSDQLQVSVSDGSHSLTKVIQVSISAVDNRAPVPDRLSELSLVITASSQLALSRENLAFVDQDSSDDEIVYHIESSPTSGQLEKAEFGQLGPGSVFTQSDINDGKIRFISAEGAGAATLTDVIRFHVTDRLGNRLANQLLTITITPLRFRPPVASPGVPLSVHAGSEVQISEENVVVRDDDTDARHLVVMVAQSPSYGVIINKINHEQESGENVRFTVHDLINGAVYFSARNHHLLENADDFFAFRVSDGRTTSDKQRVNIVIQPSLNAEPVVTATGVVCRAGHAILILSNRTLTVVDQDTPNSRLIFTVNSRLKYGKLVRFRDNLPHDMRRGWKMMKNSKMMMKNPASDLTVGSTFTYQDVLDEKICYESTEAADVSDDVTVVRRRRRDTIDFTLTDGTSWESGEINIDVEPEEVVLTSATRRSPSVRRPISPPVEWEDVDTSSAFVIEANTGLTVERGSVMRITESELRVRSSSHLQPTFVVTRDPNVGQLQFADNHEVVNITAGGDSEFTQTEIDQGFIRYYHPLSQGGGEVFFMFNVVGGATDQRFDIHVNEDHTPPRIVVNMGLQVQEGSSELITTRQLSATDHSERLFYEITQSPALGRLEFTSDPGHVISSFSQQQLAGGMVRYVHTSKLERTDDQFVFSLSDGTNSILQTFHISVVPIDNSLPVLDNSGIRVQEGVRKTITEFELKATDKDTNANLIGFHVVASPQHGAIERSTDGRRHVPVTSFTMDDVYNSRISYNHDGSNSLADGFTFTVSDGTNKQFVIYEEGSQVTTTSAQLFNIEVVPVDDGTPRLITNLGLNHLEYTDGAAMRTITKRSLLTEDPDTSPHLITYTLTSSPRHGRLESTLRSGVALNTFTQADVNAGVVRYVMTDDSNTVTRDSFMFNVRDSHPNVVTGNTFNIRWSTISFARASYTVNEEAGRVDISVTRRGNLNQYAIVLCRTVNGTATSSSSTSYDYTAHAGQVQFDEHDTEKTCSIQLNDDQLYEGPENFVVELTMPTYSLLGNITRTTVEINDEHDKPTLQLVETQYTVAERDTFVFIPIKRTGDVQKRATVVCYTETGTATGSTRDRIQTGSDYQSRERTAPESIVVFESGVTTATCDVKIIDDSIYEDSEEFVVKIVDPSHGSRTGKFVEATVTITGPNDSPGVYLTGTQFVFTENAGIVDIPVRRSGSDLSHPTEVWCSTKQSTPVSAVANEDFVETSTKITFQPEETAKVCSLTIMDDSQRPTVEGNETFVVNLNSVLKAHLAPPHEAVVTIDDTSDDVPTMSFVESAVEVAENVGEVSLVIERTGDVSGRSSVVCYTRQQDAVVERDFVERPNTQLSRIVFLPGQTAAHCNVTIVDDAIHESNENFHVQLASATGSQWYGARVGHKRQVQVTISNDEDAPTLQFERAEYSVREPASNDVTKRVSVRVMRTGDVSKVSKVRCSTRDGSAKSGSDYEPKSRMLRFQPGQNNVTIQVTILSNEDTEWHETFLIVLGPHDPVNAVLGQNSQTTVTILDKDAAGSLVLPSPPVVVSLLHYDDVGTNLKTRPSPGYPLVCVTPCDPKYPHYVDTRSLCEEAAINVSSIKFSWEVAMPTEEKDGHPPFERVTDVTPFTSVDTKVLDSIYFGRRFNVRCVAHAVDDVTKTAGTPLRSDVVTIATDTGLCHNPIESGSERSFQAQSFIANLKYIPPGAPQHENTLHVSVKIPHQDGRLPLISTMPFNNLKLLLSRTIDRQQHVCSNLMYSAKNNNSDATRSLALMGSDLGFINPTDYSKLTLGPGFDKPYQFDPTVRERKTIDLYKYLNLKSCIWQFDAHYHMNELIDYCNGKVEPDFQLRDAAESQVTVTVPLFVSYVYVTAPRGWGALEHHTDMEFTFRYDNVLWRTGIQTDGVLAGRLQVLRIKIRDDGKLVIEFKTQAKFRGQFVVSHRTLSDQMSKMVPPDGMNIAFTLHNIWTEKTFDSPYQIWQAISTYSRKDYSGEYSLRLLPCTVAPTQQWRATAPGREIPCTAYAPETFKIPIMFQQTNRPVPVVYTLKTDFQLCNNDKVFMLDPNSQDKDVDYDYKGAFTKGQTIYGRVLWRPEQDLKSAYRLQLEKVYLCTGRDGHVPYFDPTGSIYGQGAKFGCIEPSKELKHRFLLLDRSNREAEDRYFHDVAFDASFASDRPEFASMATMTGVDGFLMKVDALYKVAAGHQWYMQVLYVIGPENMVPRMRRSATRHSAMYAVNSRSKRSNGYVNKDGELAAKEILATGWSHGVESRNGTNMRSLPIDESALEGNGALVAAAAIGAVLCVAAIALCVCCCTRRRRLRMRKARDIEMEARKKTQLLADGDDDEDMEAGTKNVKRGGVVRVSNVNLNRCDSPLVRKSTLAAPVDAGAGHKANNKRSKAKCRRGNIEIVDNLRRDDSGTEV